MDRMSPRRSLRPGFTLIELLVALAVLAIVTLWVLPGAARTLDSLRLELTAGSFLATLQRARGEAISRGVAVTLCPASQGEQCTERYTNGWILFTDIDRDGRYDHERDELLMTDSALPAGITVSDRGGSRDLSQAISYLPDGSARRALTRIFCAPAGRELPPVAVVLNNVGRARLARGEGQCPGV
ncbi:MAG: GspH/FimT family pseudopilin [Pseudomonadota bacterium]